MVTYFHLRNTITYLLNCLLPVTTGGRVLFLGATHGSLHPSLGLTSKWSCFLEVKTKMFHIDPSVDPITFYSWKVQVKPAPVALLVVSRYALPGYSDWRVWVRGPGRVTTCLENLEMSGTLTAVSEMSGILLKVREVSGKTSC